MKHEWKKAEKELYLPNKNPSIIKVPELKFFTVSGKGDPNTSEKFSQKIGALYSLSYSIRMMPKSGFTPEGYFEYTVYPLEGIWDISEEAKKAQDLSKINKDDFVYTIMIRQPEFVNGELFNRALESAKKKNENPYFDEVKFEQIDDGLCVQMMHTGSFDDEPASFIIMNEYMKEHGLKRRTMTHKEIYISDFRKTDSGNLKTVLRYFVEQKN